MKIAPNSKPNPNTNPNPNPNRRSIFFVGNFMLISSSNMLKVCLA